MNIYIFSISTDFSLEITSKFEKKNINNLSYKKLKISKL